MKTEAVKVRVTPDEVIRWRAAAQRLDVTLSTFVRRGADALAARADFESPPKTCWLYKLFAGDALLYVGVSPLPARRLSDHFRNKPWGEQVTRSEMTPYASKWEAVEAENDAIRFENPRHNLRGTETYGNPSFRAIRATA